MIPRRYFRAREGGATLFRVEHDDLGRLNLVRLADINARNGRIRTPGDAPLDPQDAAAAAGWLAGATDHPAQGPADARRTVERLGLLAHWVQARASDADLAEVEGDLLLAMHDLRDALIRRRAKG